MSFARQASTVVQPPALWKSEMDATKMANAGILPGLIRYSAGVESPGDLIAISLGAERVTTQMSHVQAPNHSTTMPGTAINLAAKWATFDDHFHPRVVGWFMVTM